jgi:hypothetical protein
MDIKVATAAALAIVVGFGVEGGMHYRHQFHASSQPKLVMMQASNADFPVVAFDTAWQNEAEQLAGQRECVRKSLESVRSEMREQMSSAKQEHQLALAHARAISDQARSEMRDNIRDQVREQQQALRDQLRQQRDQIREQQQRLRDQVREAETTN